MNHEQKIKKEFKKYFFNSSYDENEFNELINNYLTEILNDEINNQVSINDYAVLLGEIEIKEDEQIVKKSTVTLYKLTVNGIGKKTWQQQEIKVPEERKQIKLTGEFEQLQYLQQVFDLLIKEKEC